MPPRARAGGGDCDDSNAEVHPGAEELCNGIDDNCDDVNPQAVTWYADADGDGFGDPKASMSTCEDDPDGFVLDDTDCDDANELANPDEDELCTNDFDDDCDGVTADGTDPDVDGSRRGVSRRQRSDATMPDYLDAVYAREERRRRGPCTGADRYCGSQRRVHRGRRRGSHVRGEERRPVASSKWGP